MNRATGELGNEITEVLVASPAELDPPLLATLDGNWTGAGDGLSHGSGGKTGTAVAKLGQEGWSQELTCSGQGVEDVGFGMLFKGLGKLFLSLVAFFDEVKGHTGQGLGLGCVGRRDFRAGKCLGIEKLPIATVLRFER